MLSSNILKNIDAFREGFEQAKPFRHACIEGFLTDAFARQLLKDFPLFNPTLAINEHGQVGRKSVRSDLREISPAYAQLYDFLRSEAFLQTASSMLGIPDLLFDDEMYGGGTHENLEGQELDPHVDFNYDQVHGYHRRVNLLIYLNEEWSEDWGGAIQLHSNPWDWENDQVKTFNCVFNRCVVFETNEYSWHGFERIELPADRKGLSRKCISVYLYTRLRPAEDIVPPHGTFYAQRPLPRDLAPGHVLSGDDVGRLRGLLKSRDQWLRLYQKHEIRTSGERLAIAGQIAELRACLRLPVQGYVSQKPGSLRGYHPDGWLEVHGECILIAQRPVTSLSLNVWVAPSLESGQRLVIRVNGELVGQWELAPDELHTLPLENLKIPLGEFHLTIESAHQVRSQESEQRPLALILNEIVFEHPVHPQ